MLDTITLLAPIGASAAKRVTAAGSETPPQVARFVGHVAPVGTFGDLVSILTQLALAPTHFAVRGEIKAGVDTSCMARKHVGEEATLEERPHRWLLIDLDSWRPDVPALDFAANPARYATEARRALPAAFHDSAMFWQATGSAGFKPGVRLRLGFWLQRALSDKELKSWIATWSLKVDTTLYSPSQPHYTSNPVFDGVADPVPAGSRTGVLPGAPEVELPSVLAVGRTSEAYAALEAAGRRVAKLEEGSRYIKLNAIAFNLAKKWTEEDLPAADIERVLGKAVSASGLPGQEVSRAFRCSITDGRTKNEVEHAGWRDLLARDKEDNPRSTQANVTLYLEHHEAFKGRVGLNERTQSTVWVRSPDWAHRDRGEPITAGDVSRIIEWFQDKAKIDTRDAWVRAGLHKAAEERPYDAVQDYLAALPAWDRAERLDTFFVRHLGAPDTELVRWMTRLWFAQAVRRAYATAKTPVKADYMILLMGDQGLGKSTVLDRVCLGGFFRDRIPSIESKDAQQALGDIWLLELADWNQSRVDRDAFKAFTTSTTDKYRPAYGRDEVRVARRCVIAITVNGDQPLTDPTGNRRFWPIMCSKSADFDAVTVEREQVWAEAVERVRQGIAPTLPTHLDQAVKDAQDEHRDEGAFVDVFRALAASGQAPMYAAVQWEPGQIDSGTLLYLRSGQACSIAGVRVDGGKGVGAVKDALKDAGWKEKRVKDDGGWRRAWYPPKSGVRVQTEAVN